MYTIILCCPPPNDVETNQEYLTMYFDFFFIDFFTHIFIDNPNKGKRSVPVLVVKYIISI